MVSAGVKGREIKKENPGKSSTGGVNRYVGHEDPTDRTGDFKPAISLAAFSFIARAGGSCQEFHCHPLPWWSLIPRPRPRPHRPFPAYGQACGLFPPSLCPV